MNYTIKEIKKYLFDLELRLIPAHWFIEGGSFSDYFLSKYPKLYDFMNDYARSDLELSDKIDGYIAKKYASFLYIASDNHESVGANASDFRVALGDYITTHAETLNRYYSLSFKNYDALSPTFRDETRTTTKEGTETVTTTKGAETVTDISGARHIESTSKVSPYESENYFENSKTIGENNASTDTRTTSERLDENEKTFDGRKDTSVINVKASNGTRTPAELLQSDTRFWIAYDFIDFLFRGFIAENCIL